MLAREGLHEAKDRYEVSHPTLLRYDLAKHAVTDTIPWPRGEEREGAQIIFSPNGDLMYFFTQDDVLIYDTNTLKEVDRWEISSTLFEEGLGRINFGFPYDVYEEPGFYTGLFPHERSGESPDADGRRANGSREPPARLLFARSEPGRELPSLAGSQARLRHPQRGRQLSVLDLRPRVAPRARQDGVPGPARAWGSSSARTAANSTSRPPAARSTGTRRASSRTSARSTSGRT